MTDQAEDCLYLIDSNGLREIAFTRSNRLKAHCLDLLQKGVIAVPVCVWDEFEDAYDDEAAQISASISKKIATNKKYNAGAARIADKLNSGFSFNPYDRSTDLFTASIALSEGYTVITAETTLGFYSKLKACKAINITELALQ